MPISSFSAPSAIARPGVCTSSSRPASPFDGQVIYETDTDKALVWNGAAWVYLSTGTTGEVGLVKVIPTGATGGTVAANGTVTFTGSSSIEIDGIFTSSFVNYKLLVTAFTNNIGELQYRFNTNGTPNANGEYWRRGFYYSGGVVSIDSSGTTEHFLVYTSNTSTVPNTAEMEIYSPQASVRTSLQVRAYDHHNAREIVYGGGFVNTTSFTGIDIFAAGGATTLTGSVRVYGYSN